MTGENTAMDPCVADAVTGVWTELCALEELAIDDGACALAQGLQVALFRTGDGGEVYAIGNHDPAGGINVLSRGIVGDIDGEPMVASPLYKQHYLLRTGQCLEDSALEVPCYPVRIVDGRVQVRVPA